MASLKVPQYTFRQKTDCPHQFVYVVMANKPINKSTRIENRVKFRVRVSVAIVQLEKVNLNT